MFGRKSIVLMFAFDPLSEALADYKIPIKKLSEDILSLYVAYISFLWYSLWNKKNHSFRMYLLLNGGESEQESLFTFPSPSLYPPSSWKLTSKKSYYYKYLWGSFIAKPLTAS